VKPSESCWTLEDSTLHILLAKAEEGTTWGSAIAGQATMLAACTHAQRDACCSVVAGDPAPPVPLAGHDLPEDQREADQKRLLLERFQIEVLWVEGPCARAAWSLLLACLPRPCLRSTCYASLHPRLSPNSTRALTSHRPSSVTAPSPTPARFCGAAWASFKVPELLCASCRSAP
jgi:hypothetical protein